MEWGGGVVVLRALMPPTRENTKPNVKILFAADLFTFTRVVARANFLVRFENITL